MGQVQKKTLKTINLNSSVKLERIQQSIAATARDMVHVSSYFLFLGNNFRLMGMLKPLTAIIRESWYTNIKFDINLIRSQTFFLIQKRKEFQSRKVTKNKTLLQILQHVHQASDAKIRKSTRFKVPSETIQNLSRSSSLYRAILSKTITNT